MDEYEPLLDGYESKCQYLDDVDDINRSMLCDDDVLDEWDELLLEFGYGE